MAEKPSEKPDVAVPVADAQEAAAAETKTDNAGANKDNAPAAEESKPSEKSAEPSAQGPKDEQNKASADADVEMRDATEAPAAEKPEAEGSSAPADADAATTSAATQTPASKAKPRRKSMAGDSTRKALNRKGSKARLTHLDAKPGDHFLVKLKGFPAWPAIICDESMLPQALVESRPQTAPRPDGSWLEQYADGGKRVNDRNFPVMYLYTNEFGWVANTNLSELTPDKAESSITDKMRKDLKEAYQLASEHHPIEFYKEVLKNFLEDLEQAMREAAATPKKGKKAKAKAPVVEEDVEMAQVEDTPQEKPKSSKKRKAEEETPQRSESVKKPKIKLNTSTPKAANGSSTPKAKEESVVKSKTKIKKSKDAAEKKAEAPKEPKMTPEERHTRKKKEVLYLRHKLQRGLLTRDQQPQETEMKSMSEFVTMLENFVELEVSIIRETKINKVLKAILKMESIPKEDEYHFKPRSQALLEKWNKLMASDASSAPTATNGLKEGQSNGVKKDSGSEKPAEKASDAKSDEATGENPNAEDVTSPPEPVEAAA